MIANISYRSTVLMLIMSTLIVEGPPFEIAKTSKDQTYYIPAGSYQWDKLYTRVPGGLQIVAIKNPTCPICFKWNHAQKLASFYCKAPPLQIYM